MPDVRLPAGSIGALVESIAGFKGHRQWFTRAYFNWAELDAILKNETRQPHLQQLNAVLEEAQRTSLTILQEWWHGSIQKRELTEAAWAALLTGAMAPLMEASDFESTDRSDEETKYIRELLRDCAEGDSLPTSLNGQESSYHMELFKLWTLEFCFGYEDPADTHLTMLKTHREDACLVATVQRIAWSCFRNLSAADNVETISQPPAGARRKLILPLQASVEVCPWLGMKRKLREAQDTMHLLPHYLWDVKEARTVQVETLTQRPTYGVISHTWGRWKKRDDPSVRVSGVPWLVPQNTRFEVTNLPDMLMNLTLRTPYVWIDLCCIPQDPLDHGDKEIRDREIGRQGEIFSAACGGVIWFNDVDNWEGLRSGIHWFVAYFLNESCMNAEPDNRTRAIQSLLPQLFHRADQASGLFTEYEYKDAASMKNASPIGWFSSLWTLQEACLMPEMVLVNRDWRPLYLGQDNLLVTLGSLISVAYLFEIHKTMMTGSSVRYDPSLEQPQRIPGSLLTYNAPNPDLPGPEAYELPPQPQSAAELTKIMHDFALNQLLKPTPASILALASQRYCRDQRAQAIMSVLGTTEWYTGYLEEFGERPPEQNLVLGRFTLPFVTEVRNKLGARFFYGMSFRFCPAEIYEMDTARIRPTRINPVGSMLPFSALNERSKHVGHFTVGSTDHPSVQSWAIKPNGCVTMTEVGILASHVVGTDVSTQPDPGPLLAQIHAHEHGKQSIAQYVDLRTWLKDYSPRDNVYAISLCRGAQARDNAGIILQQVVRDGANLLAQHPPGFKLLVSVGSWLLVKGAILTSPEVTSVDWEVL